MKSATLTTLLHACLLMLLSLDGSLGAQGTPRPPGSMAYQGYLVGLDGVPLGQAAPKAHDLVFRIYDAETGGTLLWAEEQTAAFDKGYFGVQLGEGAAVTGFTNPSAGISDVFVGTAGNNRWVELTVKGLRPGGGNLTVTPRVRLLSAPYAYLAQAASRLVDANRNELLSVSGNNLVASTTVTIPSIAVPTVVVGNLTISNSLSVLGSGGGRMVRTPDGALRVVAGRHRWTNGYPNPAAGAQFLVEPSPGYSIVRTGVGEYKVTFDTAFNSIPSIVATALRPVNGGLATAPNALAHVIQSNDTNVAKKEFTVRVHSLNYDSRNFFWLAKPILLDPASNEALMIHKTFNANNGVELQTVYSPVSLQVDWDFSFVATGG